MSADGARIAIGAIYNDGNGNDSGHVRVYDLLGNSWVKVGQDIDGETSYDNSGYSVAMSADGRRIAIGAIYNDGNGSNSGHVRVYELSGNSWVQVGQDIDGETSYDRSGISAGMSADGARIAIGAIYNDGNGNDSGHVRVYDLLGNSWVKVGQDIDGENADDNFGRSVAMSADGNKIIAGAPYNNGNGLYSGHARVYKYVPYPTITLENAVDDVLKLVYGEYPLNLNAAILSNNTDTPVIITANITDGSASFNGGVLIINKPGSFTITASQNATDNYLSVSKTFTVIIVANSPSNYANIKSLNGLKYFIGLPDKPKYYKMSKGNIDNALSQFVQFKLEN
jgi:hypothetical protein